MPTKKTKQGHPYKVDGKAFTWTTEDESEVTIPLRVKMKTLRAMSDVDMDADGMFKMIEAIAPGQSEALDEMDVNDFTNMFGAWQKEYQALSGATLGESSSSSD